MKRLLAVPFLALVLPFSTTVFSGSAFSLFAQETKNDDRYKLAVDRLESLTHAAQPEWRVHSDVPHPELPSLNDSDWQVLQVKDHWKGPRVLRRRIVVPEKVDGYDVRGGRMMLDLSFHSPDTILISLFANGSLISRGDEDTTQPVLLSENVQPGQEFLIAARVDAGEADAWLGDAS